MSNATCRWFKPLAVAVIAASVFTGSALAQSGGGDNGGLQLRLGGFFPAGGGEFWDETEAVFRFDSSDLDGFMAGATWSLALSNNFELGLNADFYYGDDRTSYRDIVDTFENEILHDVRLEQIPLTVDLRLLPAGRYRLRGSAGQYQVRRPVPYLGVGVGANIWSYEEVGDFVDFDTLEVFSASFQDEGVALVTSAVVGVEIPVGPGWNFTLEGRYYWSDDELGNDFEGLGRLQMDGAAAFVGGSWRF